ncbi:MAG: 4-hydroxy-3-methylbut-2-enyl diphosphate reductase [bacterium]
MKVTVAPHSGFCAWVARAVSEAERLIAEHGAPIFSTGALVHNPLETARLKNAGLIPSSAPWRLKNRNVIVSPHGIAEKLYRRIVENGNVIAADLTCPNVRKVQRIVSSCPPGRRVVIVGKWDHPEVRSVAGFCRKAPVVVSGIDEVNIVPADKPVCVVSQTTFPAALYDEIAGRVSALNPDARVHRSVCPSVEQRIKAAVELAARTDLFVVVGGRNSANTKALFLACRSVNPGAVLVESPGELERFLRGRHPRRGAAHSGRRACLRADTHRQATAGVTAGTSTPLWLVEKVRAILENQQ